MAVEALTLEADEDQGISAAFLRNHHGKVCIAFADPAYVRADAILLDQKDGSVHAILHQNSFFISRVSEPMCKALAENDKALLTAIKADGSVFELFVPVQVGNA